MNQIKALHISKCKCKCLLHLLRLDFWLISNFRCVFLRYVISNQFLISNSNIQHLIIILWQSQSLKKFCDMAFTLQNDFYFTFRNINHLTKLSFQTLVFNFFHHHNLSSCVQNWFNVLDGNCVRLVLAQSMLTIAYGLKIL